MTTLFISDLHLDAKLPQLSAAFAQFMQLQAPAADTLFILGDFFEVWIGDDDRSEFNLGIAELLREFTDNGGELYLMVGNRDFLMGQDFADECGAMLLDDPALIDLYGVPTLLMHGDSLCTRDTDYMAFRHLSRSPEWQQQMLSQPLEVRRAFADQARQQSQAHNRVQAADITDVTPAEVARVMQEYGVQRLIHGHTHRPARHELELNGETAERIVLGDWGSHLWWLQAEPDGTLELCQQPIDAYLAK
ncbi:UDP-2,3-diacylglucosamine diphosphatase [Pseudomaricurvus alcaniphilus]|uniref:UDP-2,3-diacylglucosamine diphosphatase n=1 Tax=Pseudomaricurvus alcaniphilus TaxID=1166482 RepID=UPI00140A5421|nr:UDP-2,3-diacylglucosamine diphosphatase [Pseudomaricurvus alcaniphilus]NHN36074.1 UDP-2,3-diacylglucosamine diphosphatase [Pseudomaricurvus alcaniphilus]